MRFREEGSCIIRFKEYFNNDQLLMWSQSFQEMGLVQEDIESENNRQTVSHLTG